MDHVNSRERSGIHARITPAGGILMQPATEVRAVIIEDFSCHMEELQLS
jgi:hypothetical protein